VKIVSGKSLGTFFREEIAQPLNIDFHIGTPSEYDARIADFIWGRTPKWFQVLLSLFSPTTAKALFRPDPVLLSKAINTREWRAAEIPASNGHGNARSVAQVGAILANGGTYEGNHVLSADTIELGLQPQIRNRDKILHIPITWGLGFQLNPPALSLGNRSFTWSGLGGSRCVMDLEKEISVAYVMNRGYLQDNRALRLIQAVKKCL
jgi:CubicO group peptidase (beta-lactamase class C family)